MARGGNTINIQINGDASGIDSATKKAIQGVDRLGDEVEKTSNNTSKLPDIDKKLTLSNALQASETVAEYSDRLGEFGIKAIESAGNMQAMNAQFQQVFGDSAGKAQQTIDKMADSFGMLPNRIKPLYTSLTSMFKGLGMSQTEAMQEAEKATNIASDAAAFYDMSLEDASSAMTSFIKGNYEGGESIGLFANDTQMASYLSLIHI